MRASSIAPLGPTSNSSKTTILVPPAAFCAGLHYQIRQPQGNWFALRAAAFSMWLSICANPLPTFGRWVGIELSER